MRLDSARELKSVLVQKMVTSIEEAVTARRLTVAAQPIDRASMMTESLALGIVRSRANDFRLAIRLQRRELSSSPEVEMIREQAKGEVDERYVGWIAKQDKPWHQQRNRPLLIGGSIGHYKITAGTLGCFVSSRKEKQPLILSNNHVLADEDRGAIGDAILQPGPYDGGTEPADTVGQLVASVKLKQAGVNYVDAAVCSIDDGIDYNYKEITGLGTLAGLGDAFLDEGTSVAKVGRTTGLTRGRVTAFELDNVVVEYDVGVLRFDDQIEIESTGDGPFSDGGDSGSFIVDSTLRGVALLFAGSDTGGSNGLGLTYANPLRRVLDDLETDLLY